jgi:hypothetical protein
MFTQVETLLKYLPPTPLRAAEANVPARVDVAAHAEVSVRAASAPVLLNVPEATVRESACVCVAAAARISSSDSFDQSRPISCMKNVNFLVYIK